MVLLNFRHGSRRILGSNSVVVYRLINRGKLEILLEGGWTCVVGLVLSLGPARCHDIFLMSKDHPIRGTSLVWLVEIMK